MLYKVVTEHTVGAVSEHSISFYTDLDEWSGPWSTQHRHLTSVDAVGPIFTCVVHAQHPVQHLLLLRVAWGRDHTVCTRAQQHPPCHNTHFTTHFTTLFHTFIPMTSRHLNTSVIQTQLKHATAGLAVVGNKIRVEKHCISPLHILNRHIESSALL